MATMDMMNRRFFFRSIVGAIGGWLVRRYVPLLDFAQEQTGYEPGWGYFADSFPPRYEDIKREVIICAGIPARYLGLEEKHEPD